MMKIGKTRAKAKLGMARADGWFRNDRWDAAEEAAFDSWRQTENSRLLLFTTAAETSYLDFAYSPGDILLFGRESAGVPAAVTVGATPAGILIVGMPMIVAERGG